jgi:hypothetical protein
MASVKIVIISQEHRGHGTSTAAYFISQALAQRQVPVLLGDLTGRHGRLPVLNKQFPARNLVLWTPPVAAMRDLPALLRMARAEVVGKASCIVLDADLTALDTLVTTDEELRSLDYLLLAIDHTTEGEKTADRLANRYLPLRDRNRIGLAFARIPPVEAQIADLPEQTDAQLPILGYWPADYRLATADDLIASGTSFPEPHQAYLDAMTRLATRLMRLVPLTKMDKN